MDIFQWTRLWQGEREREQNERHGKYPKQRPLTIIVPHYHSQLQHLLFALHCVWSLMLMACIFKHSNEWWAAARQNTCKTNRHKTYHFHHECFWRAHLFQFIYMKSDQKSQINAKLLPNLCASEFHSDDTVSKQDKNDNNKKDGDKKKRTKSSLVSFHFE